MIYGSILVYVLTGTLVARQITPERDCPPPADCGIEAPHVDMETTSLPTGDASARWMEGTINAPVVTSSAGIGDARYVGPLSGRS